MADSRVLSYHMFSFSGDVGDAREREAPLKDGDRGGADVAGDIRRSAVYVDVGDARILDIPVPFTIGGDGRNYLKCTPLASWVKLSPGGTDRRLINDVASNAGIIDEDLFYKSYPTVRVDTSTQIAIQGIGRERTKG